MSLTPGGRVESTVPSPQSAHQAHSRKLIM